MNIEISFQEVHRQPPLTKQSVSILSRNVILGHKEEAYYDQLGDRTEPPRTWHPDPHLSRGYMSQGVYVLGGKCPGGKCPGGKCPGGICPWGKCLGGKCLGGLCPRALLF